MLTTELLAPESSGSRALLIATARPEYRPPWTERLPHLSLPPLGGHHASALLDDWLGADPTLAPAPRPHRGPCSGHPPLHRGDGSRARGTW